LYSHILQWKAAEVTPPEAPKETQILFWQDPVECICWLMENPTFEGHMNYGPVKYFNNEEISEWVHGNVNTGDAWHFYQNKILDRETTKGQACLLHLISWCTEEYKNPMADRRRQILR
jgi:hypothetical protein